MAGAVFSPRSERVRSMRADEQATRNASTWIRSPHRISCSPACGVDVDASPPASKADSTISLGSICTEAAMPHAGALAAKEIRCSKLALIGRHP